MCRMLEVRKCLQIAHEAADDKPTELMEPYYHRMDTIPLKERRWEDGVYEFQVKRQRNTVCSAFIEGMFRYLGVRSSTQGSL